jgi:hypothetical protein
MEHVNKITNPAFREGILNAFGWSESLFWTDKSLDLFCTVKNGCFALPERKRSIKSKKWPFFPDRLFSNFPG